MLTTNMIRYNSLNLPCPGPLWLVFNDFIKEDVPTLGVGSTPARFFSLVCVCCCCCCGFAWFDNLTLILIRPDGHLGAGSDWLSISSINFLGVRRRFTLCATNALSIVSRSNSKRFRLDSWICCKAYQIIIRGNRISWLFQFSAYS